MVELELSGAGSGQENDAETGSSGDRGGEEEERIDARSDARSTHAAVCSSVRVRRIEVAWRGGILLLFSRLPLRATR